MTKFGSISRILHGSLMTIGVAALFGGGLIAFPLSSPPELASIHKGAQAVDRTGLPHLSRLQARDGTELAYRAYSAADQSTDRVVVMIHGSAEGSTVMNEVAKRFAAENYAVVA